MLCNPVRWLFAASLLAAHCLSSAASDRFSTEQVAVRLFSDTASVAPGQTIRVGLEQKIIPNWHTYWKNPGDSGTSTSIAWTLPAGVSVSPIQWPAPSRFAIGPITNFGYARQVVLLSSITIGRDLAPGSRLPLQAKASWLVCEESCIPQEATLALDLAVAATPGPPINQELLQDAVRRLPAQVDWKATYERVDGKLVARLALPEQIGGQDAAALVDQHTVRFYPADWGTIVHNADQVVARAGRQLTITLSPGETAPQPGAPVRGVVTIEPKGAHGDIAYAAELGAAVPPTPVAVFTPAGAPDADPLTIWRALLLAFAGGIVLNLMPCVFPVLSIKALGLLKHADASAAHKRWHGLAYTAGVLASFSLLAAALIVIKQLGHQVGWGFQFQSPYFVLGVAYLIFMVGLSLSGVFALGGPANLGAGLAARPGYGGSFFTGVLATIVATPCTAPFMGAALGFALTQPPFLLWLIFLALGLGLALPYLLLSAWPFLHRWLPRPGVWMERLKQVLAFPMYGAAAWLVWVLAQQVGVDAVPLALGGMIVLAMLAWVFDSTRTTSGALRLAVNGALLAGVAATLALTLGPAGGALPAAPVATAAQHWESYSPARLAQLRAQGKPVFINLTAAWCITCLVNEKVALATPGFRQLLKSENITYLKGDWTKQDAQISALLLQHGRSGVPLYLFYPAGVDSRAVVLPQILTHELVSTALKAGS